MIICLFRRVTLFAGFLLLTANCLSVVAASSVELRNYLPDRVGTFRRAGGFEPNDVKLDSGEFDVQTVYVGENGSRLTVALSRVPQDARAYELLTATVRGLREKEAVEIKSDFGTAGFVSSGLVGFFKGPHFVRISAANPRASVKDAVTLATQLAAQLDRGEGDIPVLVKHLPNWEQAQRTTVYLNRFKTLNAIAQDPVLSAIDSEGDAEAVLATYDSTRLLLIEFNTPQRAAENDRRTMAKIQELWKLGQPAPTGYRRIGNYSVFVFDAPNEQTAKQLIEQVKYEQVVSWLGENPNILRAAEQYYVETTLGVLIAVLKASGFALIGCVGAGGLIGALLFLRRRSQQRSAEAFSDAGGMVRLNIDELTPETNPARLIGRQ
jgi:hypothetical protein